jgi:hypothetical protein
VNDLTLAQRALEALGANESQVPIPRIVARIPDALQMLAEATQASPVREVRELLRKEFTATVVTDEEPFAHADVDTLLAGDDFLLLSSLKAADIFEDGAASPAHPLQYVPDRSSLALDRSPIFQYFTVEGTTIYLKGVVNNLTFKAGFVPTVASVPRQLEAQLVSLLASLMGGK